MCARRGAALLIVLLLLFILDCAVLGSVHLAVMERRLAHNVDTAVRLRVHAESAVREGAAAWDAATDSLTGGGPPRELLRTVTADSIELVATIQRIGESAFMMRGEARLRAPRRGRSTAALLLRPPALPADVAADGAALVVHGAVTIGEAAAVLSETVAILLADPSELEPFDAGQVSGSIGIITAPTDITARFDRVAGLFDPPAGSGSRFIDSNHVLTGEFTGTLLVAGDLRVAAGSVVSGLVVARGSLTVDAGARVEGAVHAGAGAVVGGSVVHDPGVVAAAVADAGLREPSPFRGRAWIPAF